MMIRRAAIQDLEQIMQIYDIAIAFSIHQLIDQ